MNGEMPNVREDTLERLRHYMSWCPTHQATAAIKALQGIVSTQAQTIWLARPQRTAEKR